MKKNYIIMGAIILVLIIIGGFYFYNKIKSINDSPLYGYKIGNTTVTTHTSFSNLDEESAKILAEEALSAIKEEKECFIFNSSKKTKGTITSQNDSLWKVEFTCTNECSKKYLNCGIQIVINKKYEIYQEYLD
jgi:hypothetical protein